MSISRKRRNAIELPRGVHRVIGRNRMHYYYFQPGRGTARARERIRLPNDATSAEFWSALRQAQGLQTAAASDGSVKATSTEFLAHCADRVANSDLAPSTLTAYTKTIETACDVWGDLPLAGLRAKHVQAFIDRFSPGKARNFVNCLSSFSKWARKRGHTEVNFTFGIDLPKPGKGHMPWTDEQLAAAASKFTGMMRRGFMLYMHTGLRGSDVVRLGPTDVDTFQGRDAFAIVTQKRKRDVWCPIMPPLAQEMQTWERRPGPYLLQSNGKPFTRKEFARQFAEARDAIPELKKLTLHGLRATAVINLRRAGMSFAQIGDIVGMGAKMVEHYCRNADMRSNSRAALTHLERAMAR
jgi:DNA-binding CsgD family transcriptional regulator